MSYILSEPYASLYEQYLEYEKNTVSEQGFISLKNRTKQIIKWFEEQKILLENVTVSDAFRCKEWISNTRKKDGTLISIGSIQNRLKAARKFFKYLLQTDQITENPFSVIANPRLPLHISRNVLSENQMRLLLDELKDFTKQTGRDSCIKRYCVHVYSEFLYATGLRISEAANVKLSDVDFQQRTVFIENGKGGKSRIAFLSNYVCEILKVYINNTREKIFIKNHITRTNLLFGLTSSALQHKLNSELIKTCIELGIPEITSHAFRHSLGTHLLRNGCDMRHIQIILGHDSIESTQIYTSVYKEDLRLCLDRYHPRQFVKEFHTV